MLKINKLPIYEDYRGYLASIWKESGDTLYSTYVEDRISRSIKGTIRGFHRTPYISKLCVCIYGCIRLVAFNPKTKDILNTVVHDCNLQSILIPSDYFIAHQVLSNIGILFYKWDDNYNGPETQETIIWNDPDINIKWDILPPILSERDTKAKTLKELGL